MHFVMVPSRRERVPGRLSRANEYPASRCLALCPGYRPTVSGLASKFAKGLGQTHIVMFAGVAGTAGQNPLREPRLPAVALLAVSAPQGANHRYYLHGQAHRAEV